MRLDKVLVNSFVPQYSLLPISCFGGVGAFSSGKSQRWSKARAELRDEASEDLTLR
jgi:hypothetical protein